nr:immunoglobulin heavy chain junction region [Macaca mulatta]MOW75187.1 immunoglobulin heavy chain junction region [Macaca mulatta]MOW75204.1 immunoglobulin heavy chain junction region [Macaca mulatta]MOW75249.1 immunoglobulin heavy chain junction region [Macaca mulatta]MOW75345.1 immunoglobulin heavy chain junction region [Macaca mulatta]
CARARGVYLPYFDYW